METQLALNQHFGLDCRLIDTTSKAVCHFEVDRDNNLAAVLFEQLGYLIEYPEEEQDRLGQVTKILMAPFREPHSA